jgi:hypothetical protein
MMINEYGAGSVMKIDRVNGNAPRKPFSVPFYPPHISYYLT